jgi:hypothetical protein
VKCISVYSTSFTGKRRFGNNLHKIAAKRLEDDSRLVRLSEASCNREIDIFSGAKSTASLYTGRACNRRSGESSFANWQKKKKRAC